MCGFWTVSGLSDTYGEIIPGCHGIGFDGVRNRIDLIEHPRKSVHHTGVTRMFYGDPRLLQS